jgi:hypothetical protein
VHTPSRLYAQRRQRRRDGLAALLVSAAGDAQETPTTGWFHNLEGGNGSLQAFAGACRSLQEGGERRAASATDERTTTWDNWIPRHLFRYHRPDRNRFCQPPRVEAARPGGVSETEAATCGIAHCAKQPDEALSM